MLQRSAVVAPAIGAYTWRETREGKQSAQRASENPSLTLSSNEHHSPVIKLNSHAFFRLSFLFLCSSLSVLSLSISFIFSFAYTHTHFYIPSPSERALWGGPNLFLSLSSLSSPFTFYLMCEVRASNSIFVKPTAKIINHLPHIGLFLDKPMQTALIFVLLRNNERNFAYSYVNSTSETDTQLYTVHNLPSSRQF